MRIQEADNIFNKTKTKHLIFSIIIDLLGVATYVLPVIGELGDIVYAPISGLAIFLMYKKRINSLPAGLGGIIGVIEEALPGTDFVPTATIMWIYTYVLKNQKTRNEKYYIDTGIVHKKTDPNNFSYT